MSDSGAKNVTRAVEGAATVAAELAAYAETARRSADVALRNWVSHVLSVPLSASLSRAFRAFAVKYPAFPRLLLLELSRPGAGEGMTSAARVAVLGNVGGLLAGEGRSVEVAAGKVVEFTTPGEAAANAGMVGLLLAAAR